MFSPDGEGSSCWEESPRRHSGQEFHHLWRRDWETAPSSGSGLIIHHCVGAHSLTQCNSSTDWCRLSRHVDFCHGFECYRCKKGTHTHTHAYTNIDFSHSSAGCFQDSGDETSNLFMQKKKIIFILKSNLISVWWKINNKCLKNQNSTHFCWPIVPTYKGYAVWCFHFKFLNCYLC